MSTNMKPNDVANYRRHHKDVMEVTSSRIFIASGGGQKPHPEGLLSPIIFGETPQEKKDRVGWINLGSKFLRPYAYKLIKRSFRAIDSIISGEKKYVIDEKTKELLEAEKGGGTGIKWLYDNWGKFKIKNLDTKDKDNVLLKNVKRYLNSDSKDEIFTSALIVYPLAYRDINHLDGGHIAVDEINDCFRKIILYKETMISTSDNALVDQNALRYRLQLEMVTLMEETMKLLFYKNGLHNKRLRGKHVEFASRLVISANEFTGDKFGSSPINIDTMGYPLSACATNFSLFIPREMQSILQRMYDQGEITHKGKVPSKDDFEIDYDREVMQEWIATYSKSWGERFKKVPVCGSGGKSNVKIKADILDEDGNVTGQLDKDLTITELIYLAAVRVIEEKKRVNVGSRYPIQDIYHVFPNGIHVLSTKDRMRVKINGLSYNYFPDLSSIENDTRLMEDPIMFERKVSAFFEETAKISNLRLNDINGDFDGDKMAFRPVFTEEATAECLDNINKPLHMLNYGGEDTKSIGKEGVQAAYSLTLMKPKKAKKVDSDTVALLLDTAPKDMGMKFIFKGCKLGSFGKNKAKYKVHDTFTIPSGRYNGITKSTETTIGRWLINSIVFSIVDYPYINETLGKKQMNNHFNIIAAKLNAGEIEMDTFKQMKNTYEDFVFRMSSFINPSTTKDMLVLDPKIKKKKQELFDKHREAIASGELTLVGDIQKELQNMVDDRYEDSDNMEIYQSGATKGGVRGEYTTSMLALGVVPKGIGTADFAVVESNLMDGIKKSDTHKTANTGIIGAYFRGINTASGGYMNKQASEALAPVTADKKGTDCGTNVYEEFVLEKGYVQQVIGRNIVVGSKLVNLGYDNVDEYVGKKIKMRTPYGCKTKHICYACLGDRYHKLTQQDGKIPIGIASTKPFSDLSQKSLKKSHDISVKINKIDDFNEFFV